MNKKDARESVAAELDRHVEEEGKILGRYRTLSEGLGNDSLGFLIDLILTEEELHHLLLRTMAKWLREPPAEQTHTDRRAADRDELLSHTRSLQRHERETIDACRSLQSRLAEQEGDLLHSLLDAMVLDSEKHHRLLLAVEKIIEG